jgi:hypothetical protein
MEFGLQDMGGIMEAAQKAGKTGDMSAMTKMAGARPMWSATMFERVPKSSHQGFIAISVCD